VIKKIAITGPESTGKSEMAQKLADYFNTVWVPEYAREYVAGLNRPYTIEDIKTIAQKQLKIEQQLEVKAYKLLVCDTALIVPKIWSEFVFNKNIPWIDEKITTHTYDLYLLMDIDLPWQDDPLREHPHQRKILFNRYYEELTKNNFPFGIVSGSGNHRMESALEVIKNHRLITF